MSVSDDDIWIMACLIDWEAGYQPYAGKLAVANVILNRVRSGRYPGSSFRVLYIREVSFQEYLMEQELLQTDLHQRLAKWSKKYRMYAGST